MVLIEKDIVGYVARIDYPLSIEDMIICMKDLKDQGVENIIGSGSGYDNMNKQYMVLRLEIKNKHQKN